MWGCKGRREEQGRDILYRTECYRLKDGDLVHLTDEEAEAGAGARGGLPTPWAVAWGTPHEKLGAVIW